jgi:prefoldin subunit 4
MDGVEVLQDDQARINRFGNLNTQCTSLRSELADLEKKKQAYEDANDEIGLVEGELSEVPYQVGGTFMIFPLEVAKAEAEKDAQPIAARAEEVKAVIAEKEAEMAQLRTVLYGKFGRARINLGD